MLKASRDNQLGLVGECCVLELNKNVRDGRLPRLGVAAGGSHGVRCAPASSRGGWATRQTRQSEKSEFPRIRGPKDKNRGEFFGHGVVHLELRATLTESYSLVFVYRLCVC